MRLTPSLRKGFWARSADEFKRISNIVINMEGIKGPQGPYLLHSFHEPDSIQACKLLSDAEIGGFSHGELSWTPFESSHPPTSGSHVRPESRTTSNSQQPQGYARFHGHISTELPRNRPEVQRSGYAAWRTADRGATVFGRPVWDIDSYAYLALRVRSDGRSYMVNVQTESVVPTDLHQHRLFAKRPGEWETVLIRWNDFVRTNYGRVVEPQTELLRQKVRSIGVGLTDRVPGPFELCIESVWATNRPDGGSAGGEVVVGEAEGDAAAAAVAAREGKLRNRHGERVAWSNKAES